MNVRAISLNHHANCNLLVPTILIAMDNDYFSYNQIYTSAKMDERTRSLNANYNNNHKNGHFLFVAINCCFMRFFVSVLR